MNASVDWREEKARAGETPAVKRVAERPRARRSKRSAHVLRESAAFEAVLRSGCRISSRSFVVRAIPNTTTHARLGIIAGKKAAPRAVDRNRARRIIREWFRAAAVDIGACDVTVQLRGDLRALPNAGVREELRGVLESLVRRLGRIDESLAHRQ